jgi:hypothetical protein
VWYLFGVSISSASPKQPAVTRSVRFPESLRERILQDAARCGRSFEAQVIAVLRRHYGEDVDIGPTPDAVLTLASRSVQGMSRSEQRALAARLVTDDA